MVPWYIWIYTSDIRGAGTDAQVYIVLYGREGQTEELELNNKSNPFEAGKCDEFKRDFADVGIPYKIRIRHDNQGAFAAWHLDRVSVRQHNKSIVSYRELRVIRLKWKTWSPKIDTSFRVDDGCRRKMTINKSFVNYQRLVQALKNRYQ